MTPHPASRSPITHARLTVVIPTYNEADNLPEMARALFALPLPHLHFLVVDDNSPDGTGAIADELAGRYNAAAAGEQSCRMTVIHRKQKGGLGTAYVAGFTQALEDGAEFVVQMDADFSHKPDYIPTMLETLLEKEADVVVGSRYVDGGSLDEGWGLGRRFLSWWANLYSRMILGSGTRDMTAGFKVWRRSALQGIGLERVRSNGYSFQVEMAYLCEMLGYTVVELPIHFEDRRIGQSKLDIPVKIESAWRTWQIRRQYRHLRKTAATSAETTAESTTSLHSWDAGERPSSTPQG